MYVSMRIFREGRMNIESSDGRRTNALAELLRVGNHLVHHLPRLAIVRRGDGELQHVRTCDLWAIMVALRMGMLLGVVTEQAWGLHCATLQDIVVARKKKYKANENGLNCSTVLCMRPPPPPRPNLLHLLELVHAEDAARVATVRSHLLAEALRQTAVPDGQRLGVQPLVPATRHQWSVWPGGLVE